MKKNRFFIKEKNYYELFFSKPSWTEDGVGKEELDGDEDHLLEAEVPPGIAGVVVCVDYCVIMCWDKIQP